MSPGGGSIGGRTRPRWSPSSSSVTYTPDEVRTLTPYRRTVELRGHQPELRDLFLCHAWDDRRGVATELHDLLVAEGVSVWFSERASSSANRSCERSIGVWRSRVRDSSRDPCTAEARRPPGCL